jgi:hypothetical protein
MTHRQHAERPPLSLGGRTSAMIVGPTGMSISFTLPPCFPFILFSLAASRSHAYFSCFLWAHAQDWPVQRPFIPDAPNRVLLLDFE